MLRDEGPIQMENSMQNPDRRNFLKTGAMATAGLAMTAASAKKVLGANDRIRLAVCGVRGRGWDHVRGYHSVSGVDVAFLCDVDENVLAQRCGDMEKMGMPKPQTYVDVRKL